MNNQQEMESSPLIDPSLLEGLSEEERQEALAAAAAAKRAEERAEQRALERALQLKEEARQRERQLEQEGLVEKRKALFQKVGGGGIAANVDDANAMLSASTNGSSGGRLVFVPKSKRVRNGDHDAATTSAAAVPLAAAKNMAINPAAQQLKPPPAQPQTHSRKFPPPPSASAAATASTSVVPAGWSERELSAVKETYLGKSASEKDEEQISKRKKQLTLARVGLGKVVSVESQSFFFKAFAKLIACGMVTLCCPRDVTSLRLNTLD